MAEGTGRFDGKVALVSGAGSGIGRATVLRFLAEGASVAGMDVDAGGLAATGALAGEPGAFLALTGDVSDGDGCRAAVAGAVERFGRLDVLANVAGIIRMNRVLDVSREEWDRMIGVNLTGVFLLSQAAIPALLEGGGGCIVNVASNAAFMGQAYTAAYCASKGGVVQLTRALAVEFTKTALRVNAVAPGGVDTPLAAGVTFPDDADWELVGRYMPPRGACTADEVAAAIAFLASDEARLVHGAVLNIDGGLTAG